MNNIDGISTDKIVHEYGSPIFVVSAKTLKTNLRVFREEFSKKYPRVVVAYSYKTNYLSGILDIIHKEGAWAEVASGFEYDLARLLGVPGNTVVFNGPYKKKEELKKASKEGALINVDHLDELKILEEIASELERTLEIGIRININVGVHQLPDRFGFNLDSGEAIQIVRRCVENKLLRILGLHIHLTSYIIEPDHEENTIPASRINLIWPKSPNLYRTAAENVVWFANEIREKFAVNIRYIDMGGGFPSIDLLNSYVDAIVYSILNGFKSELPILILEPGRAIVKNAMHLITTIVDVKEMADGKRRMVIDAGTNLLPTSLWKLQEIEYLVNSKSGLKETIVYGPLCLQTDIIAKTKLPELKAGNKLIIKNVGAYNFSQSSSFIFPRPCVLLIENESVKVLRKAETVDDIFKFETL